MANEVRIISDPLGNAVVLLQGICPPAGSDHNLYDDIATVVQKPAMLVEINTDPKEFYYFRSVGWHHTILLNVQMRNGRLETAGCIHNPSHEALSEILRRGRQLI